VEKKCRGGDRGRVDEMWNMNEISQGCEIKDGLRGNLEIGNSRRK